MYGSLEVSTKHLCHSWWWTKIGSLHIPLTFWVFHCLTAFWIDDLQLVWRGDGYSRHGRRCKMQQPMPGGCLGYDAFCWVTEQQVHLFCSTCRDSHSHGSSQPVVLCFISSHVGSTYLLSKYWSSKFICVTCYALARTQPWVDTLGPLQMCVANASILAV